MTRGGLTAKILDCNQSTLLRLITHITHNTGILNLVSQETTEWNSKGQHTALMEGVFRSLTAVKVLPPHRNKRSNKLKSAVILFFIVLCTGNFMFNVKRKMTETVDLCLTVIHNH